MLHGSAISRRTPSCLIVAAVVSVTLLMQAGCADPDMPVVRKQLDELRAEIATLKASITADSVELRQQSGNLRELVAISAATRRAAEQSAIDAKERIDGLEKQLQQMQKDQVALKELLKSTQEKLENVRKIADSLLAIRGESKDSDDASPEAPDASDGDGGGGEEDQGEVDKSEVETAEVDKADATGSTPE